MSSSSRTGLTRRNWLAAAPGVLAAPALLAQSQAELSARSGKRRREIIKHFDFSQGSGGVLAGFTDYHLQTADLNFLAEIRELPKELNVFSRNRRAFYLSCNNRPDDMFMFLKVPLTAADGVEQDQRYKVSLQFEVASNSTNCMGAGGNQANVFLKAGGTAVEPVPLLIGEYVSINVDKGQQSEGGEDLGVIGNIWNGQECEPDPKDRKWVMLHRTYDHPKPVTTIHQQLWIAVGTESGYESVTGVYYYSLDVKLTLLDK